MQFSACSPSQSRQSPRKSTELPKTNVASLRTAPRRRLDFIDRLQLRFQRQCLDVVEHHRRLDERQSVYLPHLAVSVDQKHLQHMVHGARRAAVLVGIDAHVLAEIIEYG